MPNHVENIITLNGDEAKIRKMLEAIKSDDYGLGTIDFNKIITMPESLNIEAGSRTDRGLKAHKEFISECLLNVGTTDASKLSDEFMAAAEKEFLSQYKDIKPDEWELGKTAWKNVQQYGAPTWYEWCINNWGTKWNAYGYDEDTDYSKNTDLWFQTAWSAPHSVIEKLAAKFPDIAFEHEWADEDIGANCGRKTYQNGECTEEYYPETQKESIEFACRVWEYDPIDLELCVNKSEDKYINIENENYALIELFGKPALFTNDRLTDADIPKGLYCYHLRHSDDGDRFATIEQKVTVNHGGSVITDELIDFGKQGYIAFTEDTEPNFMGEDLTFGEYMQGEFEQSEYETQGFGGM